MIEIGLLVMQWVSRSHAPDFDHKILGWDLNENISHAYTSVVLNITVFDRSLPIIFLTVSKSDI